jgi:hypothetical protein
MTLLADATHIIGPAVELVSRRFVEGVHSPTVVANAPPIDMTPLETCEDNAFGDTLIASRKPGTHT